MKRILALPYITLAVVFFIAPLAVGLYLSFFEGVLEIEFVGLDHYLFLLTADFFWNAMHNTGVFIILTMVISIPLSFVLSSIMFDFGVKDPLKLSMLLIPFIVPSMALSDSYKLLFKMCLENPLVWSGLVFLWKQMGIQIVVYFIGLTLLDPNIDEAAQVDGAGYLTRLTYMRIPMMKSYHILVVIITLINSNRIFNEIYATFGNTIPDSLYMVQNMIFDLMQTMNFNALMVIEMLVCIMLLIIFSLIKMKRMVRNYEK